MDGEEVVNPSYCSTGAFHLPCIQDTATGSGPLSSYQQTLLHNGKHGALLLKAPRTGTMIEDDILIDSTSRKAISIGEGETFSFDTDGYSVGKDDQGWYYPIVSVTLVWWDYSPDLLLMLVRPVRQRRPDLRKWI